MTSSRLRQLKHQVEDAIEELLEDAEVPDSFDRERLEEFLNRFRDMYITRKISDITS